MNTEKLELHHLCSYLPYGLMIQSELGIGSPCIAELTIFNCDLLLVHLDRVKPLLIPLSEFAIDDKPMRELIEFAYKSVYQSDLSKETIIMLVPGSDEWGAVFNVDDYRYGFSVNFAGERDFKFTWSQNDNQGRELILDKLALFNILFKYHFDVFDLINKGIALNKSDHEH